MGLKVTAEEVTFKDSVITLTEPPPDLSLLLTSYFEKKVSVTLTGVSIKSQGLFLLTSVNFTGV